MKNCKNEKYVNKQNKENKNKIQPMPIDKDAYYLKGGYLLFTYNLLKKSDNILSYSEDSGTHVRSNNDVHVEPKVSIKFMCP